MIKKYIEAKSGFQGIVQNNKAACLLKWVSGCFIQCNIIKSVL